MTRTRKSKTTDGLRNTQKGEKTLKLEEKNDDDFVVHNIEDEELEPKMEVTNMPETTALKEEPKVSEKVKVKFSNFVQLVANHNFEQVINKNNDEDVIVSSDLLADLANSHEQEEERRIPAIFIIGVVLGVIITYILLEF
jgi:hypothetical protein